MPKLELDGEELFNLALAIVGLVLKEGSLTTAELAQHFEVSEAAILKATKAIAGSEDLHRYETHFYVDEELLADGEVSFGLGQGQLSTPPILSKSQASAIAVGLDYLASLPQFEANPDLADLRSSLGGSITSAATEPGPDSELLGQLRQAILEDQQLLLSYQNQLGERGERLVDPLRLDFVGKKHYLRAWCHKNQELRSFRLDRIMRVGLTGEPRSPNAITAEIPEDVYGAGNDEHLVTIRAAKTATEIFWNFPLAAEPEELGQEVQGQIRVGSLAALGRHISRYGGLVRVIEPEKARQAVLEYAQNALRPLAQEG
jgi:proteasome accessory factor C